MQIKGNTQSALRLSNIFFKEVHMETSGKKIANSNDVHVAFKVDNPVITDENLKVRMHCKVEIEDALNLYLLLIGEFQSNDKTFLKRMVPNAIAIIFPYMRSQVTLMTAQPNLPPIVLPPININALLEENKKK